MADTKISAMGAAATLSLINTVPVVQGTNNRFATLGQIKALSNLPIIGITTGALISLSYELVSISGTCTLPVGTDGSQDYSDCHRCGYSHRHRNFLYFLCW